MSQTTSVSPLPRYLDKVFEGLTWLILGATPLLINVYNVDAYRTVQATFASIVIALCLGVWAVSRSVSRSWSEVGKVPLLWGIAAFSLWTLVTVPRSPSAPIGLASWWNLTSYLVFWIAVADMSARDARLRWRLLIPLFVGFTANSVMGLMQYQHAPFMAYYQSFPQAAWISNYFAGLDAPAKLGSAAGMLGNQNVLGDYLVGLIPIGFMVGFTFVAKRKNVWAGMAMLLSAVLGSASLIATQTRGSWIGLALGLVYAAGVLLAVYGKALRRLNAKTWIAIALGVAVLGGGVAWKGESFGLGRAFSKLQNVGNDSTSMQRIHAWSVAKTMADEQPVFGQGLATYKILYFKYLVKTFNGKPIPPIMHHRYVQAHNDFIQLAGESGYVGFLLGLGLLFAFVGSMTWWIFKKTALEGAERMLALGGVAGLVSIAVSGIFGFPFHIASSSVLAVAVAALAGGIWTQDRRLAQQNAAVTLYSDAQIAVYNYAMPLAIVILTMALVWSNWTPYQADKLTKQGQEFYRMGRFPEAQDVLLKASKLDPERGDARMMVGLIYAMGGRFPESINELNAAQRSYDDVTLHYYMGRVYESLMRPDMARKEYSNALNYFPGGMDITRAVSERIAILDDPASASAEQAKMRAAQEAQAQAIANMRRQAAEQAAAQAAGQAKH